MTDALITVRKVSGLQEWAIRTTIHGVYQERLYCEEMDRKAAYGTALAISKELQRNGQAVTVEIK